jgi:hypothetical protein
MGINYNTTATNRGLLLSCDFANAQNYSRSNENLFLYSERFDVANWSKFQISVTSTTELNPFQQATGVYLVANIPNAIPGSFIGQGTALSNSCTYTISLYVKPVFGTGVVAFEINAGTGYTVPTFNLSSLTTSGGNGVNTIQALSNGWYRLSATVTMGATGDCQFSVFYFGNYGSSSVQSQFLIYGAQLERSSSSGNYVSTIAAAVVSNTISDRISGLSGSLNNNGYCYFDTVTNSMRFDRSATVVTGGFAQFTGTGNLTATNFFYNDHTMEIFARINNYAASGINANEGSNALFVYQGYHAGFQYDAGNGLFYGLWGASPIVAPIWAYPSSPTVGTWFHAVATRSGTTTTIYLNGEQVASSSYAINGNPGISDFIKIGAGNPGTGPYASYTKMNASIARLYNTALTAAEVKQNFNAFRGRGGI